MSAINGLTSNTSTQALIDAVRYVIAEMAGRDQDSKPELLRAATAKLQEAAVLDRPRPVTVRKI